jgi:uncharacterized protein (DUF427 family)
MSDTEHVTLEPIKLIRVHRDGQLVAETARGYVVHEKGLSDRYYIPRADIRATLSDGTTDGHCPWKGEWKHLDVQISDVLKVPDGAWTYYAPTPVCAPIKDFVAFYDSKFQIDHIR